MTAVVKATDAKNPNRARANEGAGMSIVMVDPAVKGVVASWAGPTDGMFQGYFARGLKVLRHEGLDRIAKASKFARQADRR